MAYLVKRKAPSGHYHYIMQSKRKGATVTNRILEYLGRDPDPATLKRALVYWRVEPKHRRTSR